MSDCDPPPWTVACHAPLSTGFPRQEYWSGLPFSPSEDLPDPRNELVSSTWQVDSLSLSHLGSPSYTVIFRFLMGVKFILQICNTIMMYRLFTTDHMDYANLDHIYLYMRAKSPRLCLTLCDPMGHRSARLPCPWDFSRQEYWSGLPCPPPGDLPNQPRN